MNAFSILPAVLVSIVSIAAPSAAIAAGGVGNGGIGVICRDSSGEIKSAELLDLYEAREINGWLTAEGIRKLEDFYQNRESAAILAMDTSSRIFLRHVSQNHGYIYNKELLTLMASFVDENEPRALRPDTEIRFTRTSSKNSTLRENLVRNGFASPYQGNVRSISPNQKLNLTEDFTTVTTPKGCAYEQIATYASDNVLYIDPELFDALSPLNQGALFYHEAVWAMHRKSGLTSSDLARKLVGTTYAYMAEWVAGQGDSEHSVEMIRRTAIVAHLTLKLDYNYNADFAFKTIQIDPSERGHLNFSYHVTGDLAAVECQAKTQWLDWTTDRNRNVFERSATTEIDFERLKGIPVAQVNLPAPEYQSLRFTSLSPTFSCSLKSGFEAAKIHVRFQVRKGTRVLYETNLGEASLHSVSGKKETTLEDGQGRKTLFL